MAGASLSDILTAIQQGVVALNKLGSQIKGSFTAILGRFVADEANIATNTTNIATNTTNIATNTTNIVALQALVPLAKLTNSLGADVNMNNIANYFTGPTVAQGTSGTWFASGSITVLDNSGAAAMSAKLWDGTTIIASGTCTITTVGFSHVIALSGFITSPAANIRIDCRDSSSTNGLIKFNNSGNSKDSTLTVLRIA